MSFQSGKLLKSSFGTAAATFASRLCGLLRVRLEATVLGGGVWASAWGLALTIPNMFRRLLGEGALGTALIPLVAEIERREGVDAVRRKLATVLIALGVLLSLIVLVISLAALGSGKWIALYGNEFWRSARITQMIRLLPLLMPYAFFICLTGVIGAVLNYAKIFVRPALTALLFNLFMLAGLGAAWLGHWSPETVLPFLAVLTPAAGAIQLALMLWMLSLCGRYPRFVSVWWSDREILGKLWRLALPGILGYGALQMSFLVDRSLAVALGDRAVPALNYVDRVIDLPIGIFAVSLGSVLMSAMSRAAAEGDRETMREQLAFSLRHVWFLCAPLAAGVVFFHADILRVLCLGGRYTLDDLRAARMVAVFYGMGIPFFCSLKVILPAFYARKQMKTPFYVSLAAITVNITLNLVLMWPLRQGGIALATVISSLVNNGVLMTILRRQGMGAGWRTAFSALRSAAVAAVSGGAVWYGLHRAGIGLAGYGGMGANILLLAGIAAAFGILYVGISALVRAPELRELASLLRRRGGRG
ncbi:MAG: murein biosynthesis integral membrane protein MurJ [Lentisphaeria bacterium]|nr:murein biosynthesis integral membrane protein MurJ [Lentisphaeria bacterium]